jgi:hypothetical protein
MATMTECGTRVGKGLVTYPCDLERGHPGPCRAQENQPSVRQRRTWEGEQAEAIMAPLEEIDLSKPATMTGQVAPRDVPHQPPSDTLHEARQALQEVVAVIERLMDQRKDLGDLLSEIEAALPASAVEARSATSMLRAMLRA